MSVIRSCSIYIVNNYFLIALLIVIKSYTSIAIPIDYLPPLDNVNRPGNISLYTGESDQVIPTINEGVENANNGDEHDEEEDTWLWTKEDYPNPMTKPRSCRRYRASVICDPDEVLTKQQANRLEAMVKKIDNETICICETCPPDKGSINIGIALMKNIYHETEDPLQNIKQFAEYLRQKWKLGTCENDVIILISTKDYQTYTVMGENAAKVFPEHVSDEILIQTRSHFTNGFYYQGLESIIQSYHDTLKKLQYAGTPEGHQSEDERQTNVGLIIGVVVGFAALLVALVGFLYYVKQRINADDGRFDFEGVLGKSFWLNKKDNFKPVSINPIISPGSVYEPCSIEEKVKGDKQKQQQQQQQSADARLKAKLSQIESTSSSDNDDDGDEATTERQRLKSAGFMNDESNGRTNVTNVNQAVKKSSAPHTIELDAVNEDQEQEFGIDETDPPSPPKPPKPPKRLPRGAVGPV